MDIRQLFFKLRSYTPIPFLALLIYTSEPILESFIWGLILIIAGEGIRLWGVAHAGEFTRTLDVKAPTLVTSGPFAHTRNPLYLGNALIYLGVVCLAGGQSLWILITLAFCALQYSLIVSLEEETLVDLFSIEYKLYRRGVPRWIPRLTPWNWSLPRQANWRDAWRTEKNTHINLSVVVIIFAIIGLL